MSRIRSASWCDLGPGKLRLEHLAAADPKAGEHREREDDDPHPPEPLAQLAPQEHRAVEALDIARRSSRRSSRSPTCPRRTRPRDARAGARRRRGMGARRTRPPAARSARRRGSPHGSRSGPATDAPSRISAKAHAAGDRTCRRRTATTARRSRSRRRPAGATRRSRYASIVPVRPSAPATSIPSHARADPIGRSIGWSPSQRTRSTSGTRYVSVKTITRSPAWSTSSLRGNIARPSRTIAPIIAPRIGMSRKRSPTYSLVGCVVMSSTS